MPYYCVPEDIVNKYNDNDRWTVAAIKQAHDQQLHLRAPNNEPYWCSGCPECPICRCPVPIDEHTNIFD